MFRLTTLLTGLSLIALSSLPTYAQNPFAQNIRKTKPLSPAEQLKKFHLPPGFEIQLVAAEPRIQKPMNLAFDARGRLWVTGSVEYPYAARPGAGRDTIKVLEDTNGDGKADKVTTFARGLNIPIGLYPYKDGVVVYTIPDIVFFRDTDGDGKADKREVLYKNLGEPRDVHGLQNAFRRGFDGWLYVCHGFANTSTIRGRDGSRITLQSGNTYRIRLDGSRVEQFTWGQVNPFGMAIAENGDIFTADCHSKPLTLLLRGGYYPSFGKPHDGLGFVKPVMSHLHGSTAIAGAAICSGKAWPARYRGSLFVGNVMTSRVHRDTLVYRGGTVQAKEQADFLICDDPWFRPVDVRFGPDGALYIADFYNRIIGHYEVPLDHPGRDRTSGRIWRVVYTGGKSKPKRPNLASRDVNQLIASLANPNLAVRMLATDQLTDRYGKAAVAPLRKAVATSTSPTVLVHGLWALHRLGGLRESHIVSAAKHKSALVRTHAMRILAETKTWPTAYRALAVAGVKDKNAVVRRCAADALGRHTEVDAVRLLLDESQRTAGDPHLQHVLKMALRNQLQVKGRLAKIDPDRLRRESLTTLVDIAKAVNTTEAADFLIRYLSETKVDNNAMRTALAHAARYVSADRLDALVKLARSRVGDDVDLQLAILNSFHNGLRQRGVKEARSVRDWATTLAGQLLKSIDTGSASWGSRTVGNPWGLETRSSADGNKGTKFLSSLPGGERQTGVLRSKPFKIPKRLRFYICGHLGFQKQAAVPKNLVRLRLVKSGRTIASRLAPRNDLAQKVEWKLDKHAGKRGYLEIVDGLNLRAYAWVAVARFDPPVVAVPRLSPSLVARRQSAAAAIVARYRIRKSLPMMKRLVTSAHTDWSVRAAAAKALLAFRPDPIAAALTELIAAPSAPNTLRTAICAAVAKSDSDGNAKLLEQAMRTAPSGLQLRIANQLAATRAGGEALLTLVQLGQASARLLQQEDVRQKLLASKPASVEARLKKLTASLPDLKRETQRLILVRTRGYRAAGGSPVRGQAIFKKHCAACHQVAGKGALVGPQLDGIGIRGLERVVEDLLDPNRNVDKNFHTTVYVLKNGKILMGQFRQRSGKILIIADKQGKEFTIPVDEIDVQKKSKMSLMPTNVGSQLKPKEFNDLIAWLLTLRQSPERTKKKPAAGG